MAATHNTKEVVATVTLTNSIKDITKDEWDICAGHLLVTEAGGSVTTSHGSDINYNSSTGSSQGIIAGKAIVREAISAQLNL